MRIVVQSMDHYERLGGRLRRDFLGERSGDSGLLAAGFPRASPSENPYCLPQGPLQTSWWELWRCKRPSVIFWTRGPAGKLAFSPGFRRCAPTSLPACGGAVQ